MHKSILVPLDGSETAEKILAYAEDYARGGARVHLVRVLPSDVPLNGQRGAALRYLARIEKRLRRDGVQCRIHVRRGVAAEAIAETARKVRADVILMTTRGATTASRALFGGTAEKLIRIAPKALFVLHAGDAVPRARPISIPRILVPLDGSSLSESILVEAVNLAQWHESEILLLYVASKNSPAVRYSRIEDFAALFSKWGIPTNVLSASGDPATEILSAARQRRVGLIALNSHGRSGFSRFMMGSVAEEVLHGAHGPVYLTFHKLALRAEKLKPRLLSDLSRFEE